MGKTAIEAPRGATLFNVDPEACVIVGFDTDDGPEHELWQDRAKEAPSKELALDIIDQGVLEPVIVRRNGSTTEVVAGRRRVKATRLANEMLLDRDGKAAQLIKVPCLVRRGDAKAHFRVVLAENEQRQDLDLLAKAKMTQRGVNFGMTEAELAAASGVSQQTIKNRLALLDTAAAVQHAVRDGKIPVTAAIKLAPLEHKDQLEELEKLIESGDTTGRAAALAARNRKKNGKRGKDDEPEHPRPGARLLRKIVDSENAGEAISTDALRTIKWVLGLTPASQIKGLSALVASIEEGE